MKTFKRELLISAVCSVLFATVFGFIVSCNESGRMTSIPGGGPRPSSLVRLINHAGRSMVTIPQRLNKNEPLLASIFFFQSTPSSSQLQQSFQGTGPCLEGAMPTTGFIPLNLLSESEIVVSTTQVKLACQGVFAQIGGGIDQISGGTLTNPGLPMFMAGTLTTLVVTGLSAKGIQIRCSDLTTMVTVQDQDLVQPYFVPATNSVVLGIGTTQLPFTCNLNVPQGDSVSNGLTVQWAKI